MVLKKFTYLDGKKKKSIQVKECKTIVSKTKGLMFKKKSVPLLFIFKKEKKLSIHSFFCKPFTAIWLDEDKKVTKEEEVSSWKANISGNGKYLLEIPLRPKRAKLPSRKVKKQKGLNTK